MTNKIIAIRKSTIHPNYVSEISHYKFSDEAIIEKDIFFSNYYIKGSDYYCVSGNNIKLLYYDTLNGKAFFKTAPNSTTSDNLLSLPTL